MLGICKLLVNIRCAKCKHTYNVKTKNEHICGRKYCQLCYRYHDDDKGNILYE